MKTKPKGANYRNLYAWRGSGRSRRQRPRNGFLPKFGRKVVAREAELAMRDKNVTNKKRGRRPAEREPGEKDEGVSP